ncbi:aldo/keto reductase [Kribbella sp. NPDC050124]|uniref:aldo/keto reductase n=1 Tax=Kribbella sp. NPDC050124 TaxID=3364114 RepID=UPI00378B5E68
MLYRTIGNRREVSALCLGAMNFGSTTDPETAFAILDRFVEAGGTFIDTSNNYNQWHGRGGESEELLGRWMKSRGNRDELVIATKVGAKSTRPGSPDDEHWEGLSATAIESAVKGSLDRLGVDRIDLYYAHIDDRRTPLEETVATFGRLAAEGVVDLIGCSNTTSWRLDRARQLAANQGVAQYSVVQQHHTYLWPNPPALQGIERLGSPHYTHAGLEHLDYLTEHPEMALVAYSPLLSGSYAHLNRPFPASRGYAHPTAYTRFETLRHLSQSLNATPNQLVLSWLLHHPQPLIPLFGASTLPQLEEALTATTLALTPDHLNQLNNA